MKIAILYICTGKYDVFWGDFYASAEQLFCLGQDKHYFIFTDSRQIPATDKVSLIYQDSLGWPFNTLYRYQMFLRIKDQLLEYDKVVFFNGNCLFQVAITAVEFFGEQKKLVACLHPGFFDKEVQLFTYETRSESLAFVKSAHHYFAGGINGGDSSQFIQVSQIIADNIEQDLKQGLLAVWHDESHWNAWLNNNFQQLVHQLHILGPEYLYPLGWKLNLKPKIVLRDKSIFGGHDYLRNSNPRPSSKLASLIKYFIRR